MMGEMAIKTETRVGDLISILNRYEWDEPVRLCAFGSESEKARLIVGNDPVIESEDGLDTLLDMIAEYLETEENRDRLRRCWLIDDRSEDLRMLLWEAVEKTANSAPTIAWGNNSR